MRKAQIEDWLEDVVEFGPVIVAEACREWRRTSSRRPTPNEVRVLCIAEQQKLPAQTALPPADRARIAELRALDQKAQREQYENARLARERMAEELGYPSFGYMMSIGLANAVNSAYAHGRGAGKIPTAADFGVTAREYTPEQMAQARAELVDHGMPPDPHDDLLPPGLDANGKPTGAGEAVLRPEAAE